MHDGEQTTKYESEISVYKEADTMAAADMMGLNQEDCF